MAWREFEDGAIECKAGGSQFAVGGDGRAEFMRPIPVVHPARARFHVWIVEVEVLEDDTCGVAFNAQAIEAPARSR
jgi:hypothetical protein